MLMSAAIRPVPLKPDVSELLSRARAIAEIVRARAQATETNRRIADDVIERMREAELFRILQPNAYGGFEYGFDVFAELVAAIGRGCGSSAWVYGLGAVSLCASRQDGSRRRGLSDHRRLELRQRLRQCAVVLPRHHDPAC